MKLVTMSVFAAGYVLGTKAGRERYDQLVVAARMVGRRLEDYADRGGESIDGADTTDEDAATGS